MHEPCRKELYSRCCAWCRAVHEQEQSHEQVDQNGVLVWSVIDLASVIVLLASPQVPLHALTEPMTETKTIATLYALHRSQHNKALCILFTRSP